MNGFTALLHQTLRIFYTLLNTIYKQTMHNILECFSDLGEKHTFAASYDNILCYFIDTFSLHRRILTTTLENYMDRMFRIS